MDRFLVPFLAGLLGAAAGALGAARWMPAGHAGPEPAAEARGLDDLKDQVAEIRRILDRPGLAPAPAGAPAGKKSHPYTAGSDGAEAGTAAGTRTTITVAELEAVAEKAAAAAVEKHTAAAKEEKAQESAEKKRAPLADVARELGLTAAQETDVRRAYAESTDALLKVMAEPESDTETLRRELLAAKGDPAKKSEITMKYIPKFMTKLGDVMKIEMDRQTKLNAAVGPEMVKKLSKWKLEEEDPFGLDGDVTVGVSATDGR